MYAIRSYYDEKGALGKTYMTDMRQLAEQLTTGTAPKGQAYPYKVSIGPDNPIV